MKPHFSEPDRHSLSAERAQPAALAARFRRVRLQTEHLAQPLSAEDCALQSMPDASPVKWHLAHTTWFFETFILKAHDPLYAALDARYEYLFNSYYNGVGPQFFRPDRGVCVGGWSAVAAGERTFFRRSK